MIVFDEHWLTVRWDESLQASFAEHKGYAEGAELRAGYNAIISLCQRKRNRRHLGDARQLAPVSQADQRWINTEVFPQLIGAGIRFMAIVSPKAAVARLTVRQVMSKVNEVSLVTHHFDDLEAARDWLRGV